MGDDNKKSKKMPTEVETSPELKKQVVDFKKNVSIEALALVHQTMPNKVLQLEALFRNTPQFNLKLAEIVQPVVTGTASAALKKKRRMGDNDEPEGSDAQEKVVVPCNRVILELLSFLKKEILDLIEILNTVKIWIQLNIPRIEDGNNFGVSIQEETVSELGRAEDSGLGVLESMTKYFVTRAKLVSKVLKYPDVSDYRQSIIELDEKEFINLRLCCMDLRNNYAILYDMITKNLEKIKTPRSSNHMTTMI